MSVKILMRRPGPQIGSTILPSSAPTVSSLPSIKNILAGVGSKISSAFATRKSASGEALSFVEKVGEFIARNVPSVDVSTVIGLMSAAKIPVLAALGVAAAGGIVYLAYKLYKHFTEKGAKETIATIMKDLRDIAPDIFNVPGWAEQIETDVAAAVESGPEEMINKIADIKTTLLEKQRATSPKNIGAGINVFAGELPYPAQIRGMGGAGLMTI